MCRITLSTFVNINSRIFKVAQNFLEVRSSKLHKLTEAKTLDPERKLCTFTTTKPNPTEDSKHCIIVIFLETLSDIRTHNDYFKRQLFAAWYRLTLRRLMSYIYGAPILDVSRSHTTTQHSR